MRVGFSSRLVACWAERRKKDMFAHGRGRIDHVWMTQSDQKNEGVGRTETNEGHWAGARGSA